MYIRKLSFRETFDFENESTAASDDFLSDIFFTAKRKLTGDFQISNLSPKKLCHAFETEKAQNPDFNPQSLITNQYHWLLGDNINLQIDNMHKYCLRVQIMKLIHTLLIWMK